MATIKIIVKKEKGEIKVNSKSEALVYIQYGHAGKTTLFSTGIKINIEFLKFDKNGLDQREPVKKSQNGYTTKNTNIRKVLNEVDSIKDKLVNQDIEPTVEAVKEVFEEKNKPVEEKKKDFFELFDDFINSPGSKAHSTIKSYRTVYNNMKSFEKVKKEKITLEKINYDLYNKLVNYFLSDHKLPDETTGLNLNAVGNQIKILKAFLRHLEKVGYKFNTDLKLFKVYKEKPVIIYLSQEELDSLYNHDFSNNEKLGRIRDIFMVQCQTGLRISDLKRLGPEHIQNGTIYMKAQKTGTNICVPLTPKADEILRKYNYELPLISEQKINEYLKDTCQEVGINSKIEIPEFRNGQKVYKKYFKYELITTHIAVKTFISHCAEKGISPKVVSTIVGKSMQVIINHYYGTTSKVIEMEMQRAFGVVEPKLKVS